MSMTPQDARWLRFAEAAIRTGQLVALLSRAEQAETDRDALREQARLADLRHRTSSRIMTAEGPTLIVIANILGMKEE